MTTSLRSIIETAFARSSVVPFPSTASPKAATPAAPRVDRSSIIKEMTRAIARVSVDEQRTGTEGLVLLMTEAITAAAGHVADGAAAADANLQSEIRELRQALAHLQRQRDEVQ